MSDLLEAREIKEILTEQRYFAATRITHTLSFRKEQLQKLATLLQTHETALLTALTADLGKHPTESIMTELGMVRRSIRYALKHLHTWSKQKKVRTPLSLQPARSYTVASPLGIALIISPFNYPLLLALDPLVGSIAAGNTSVLSLSEYTPHTNAVLLQAFAQFFPREYIFVCVGGIQTNTKLLNEPFDKIFFTGSTTVGKIVMQAASRYLTPLTLELGGKSPAIITKHANLTVAAERIAWGKYLNAGQTCVAPDYCLVDATVQQDFIHLLQVAITKLYGTDIQNSVDYPRIINQTHVQRLTNLLTHDGKYIVFGGTTDASTLYIEPTILHAPIGTKLQAMDDEIFGPILPVLSYTDLTSAIEYVQTHPSPLSFYPFSEDSQEIELLLSTLQFGGATVNDTILHLANEHLPFGGVGASGMGSYHGQKSFEAFSHQKSILTRSTSLSFPIMHAPYTKLKTKIIKFFQK